MSENPPCNPYEEEHEYIPNKEQPGKRVLDILNITHGIEERVEILQRKLWLINHDYDIREHMIQDEMDHNKKIAQKCAKNILYEIRQAQNAVRLIHIDAERQLKFEKYMDEKYGNDDKKDDKNGCDKDTTSD